MESDAGSVIIESSDNGISLIRTENGVPVFLKKRPKKIKKKRVQKAPFKCQHCNEEFPNYDIHAKHVETVHPVPHACPTPNCYYRTARKWYMRAHIRRVHGENAIKCPIDGCEGYFVKKALQKHVKTAHRNNYIEPSAKLKKSLHKCEQCKYQTESSNLYEHHTKDYHLNGFICPVDFCEENIFADKIGQHFEELHNGIEYEYKLGKGIKLKDIISRDKTANEMDVETEQHNIGTNEASNEMDVEGEGEQHEKENSDMDYEFETEKTAVGFNGFTCPKCSKTFMLRRSLIRHIASVHEKRYKKYERAKKFECTFENCSKSFKCQTLLNDHLNMHNGNYVYKCDNCSQQFFARAQFAIHLTKYHNKSIKDISKNSIVSESQAAATVMVSG
uniref:C2H2-type domain-containing protein n=1 Tax=Panagrolaimus sp. ES5 TaxID=591445 RepID=A0AC34GRM5_9BILA